jgi:hypothetical protein
MSNLRIISSIFLAAWATLGCGGGTPADPELTCDANPAAATLSTNVQAVFEAKCVMCHGSNYAYGDYTTAAKTFESTNGKTSYLAQSVMGSTLKVVDGANKSLANSSLWLKVLGGDAANRRGPKGERTLGAMPNDGSTLTAEQKKLLKDWICTGAAL